MAKKNKDYNAGGVVLVGCMILGFGVGTWFDHGLAGLLSGTGFGFIAMALITNGYSK